MKNKLKLIPLEERIVLDAALGSAIAHTSSHPAPASNIIYVDAHAASGGNGSSWAHAYNSLQDALTAASHTSTPEQIWIAQGNYTPSQVYSPNGVTGGASGLNTAQLQTFNLPNNVTLIGGFVSGDTSISQSNPSLHPTLLNGSLGNGTDVWHVVTLGNDISQTGVTATLENLTVENGLANGPDSLSSTGTLNYSHESGGGIYETFGSNLTISGVTLTNDSAALAANQGIPPPATASGLVPGGGGIAVIDSTLTVNNSTFTHDSAGVATTVYGDGGAIYADQSNVTISNSTFNNNTAATSGGAVALESMTSAVNISDSTFNANSVTNAPAPNFGGGGGIQIYNSDLNLSNSVVSNNTSQYSAGAMLIQFQADSPHSIVLQGDTFSGNYARYEAGAITVTSQGDANAADLVTINNSFFLNNYSAGVAGGIDIDSINVNINNTEFVGNTAAGSAGALNSDDFFNSFLGTPFTTVNLNKDTFLANVAQGSVAANAGWTGLFSGAAFGATLSPGGGAVESMWNSQINVMNSTFTGNLALNGDGAAFLNGGGHMYLGSTSNIIATATTMTLSNDTIVGNIALKGNGGAMANETDAPGYPQPDLIVKNSLISLNSASNDGGGIYSNDTIDTIQGDTFLLNFASKGSEVWATDSTINGESSSSATAAHDLALANSFYLLHNGDIVLS